MVTLLNFVREAEEFSAECLTGTQHCLRSGTGGICHLRQVQRIEPKAVLTIQDLESIMTITMAKFSGEVFEVLRRDRSSRPPSAQSPLVKEIIAGTADKAAAVEGEQDKDAEDKDAASPRALPLEHTPDYLPPLELLKCHQYVRQWVTLFSRYAQQHNDVDFDDKFVRRCPLSDLPTPIPPGPDPCPTAPGMHQKGRGLRGGPGGGSTGGWRRLPKRSGAVTIGYKCP